MDRASLRNLFLASGIDAEHAAPSDALVSSSSSSFGTVSNNNAQQPSNQGDVAGYPFLLQEYLRQQNQQQQEAALQNVSSVGLDNMPLMGMPGPTISNRSFASFDSTAGNPALSLQGPARNANWFVAPGPPSVAGTQTSSASDLSTSDRMLLERLQVQANASFGVVGNNTPPSVSLDPYAQQGILGPWSERSAGLLGSMVSTEGTSQPGKVKRTRRKQPKDKPKRPLSAYNIFFKEERARLLSKAPTDGSDGGESSQKRTASGKIGFENLAKIIGGKWQDLQPREVEYYKTKASADMERYKKEMDEYNKKQSSAIQNDESEEIDGVEEKASKRQKS